MCLFCSQGPVASFLTLQPCRKYLRRPVVITIGTAGKATDNITQRVIVSSLAAAPRQHDVQRECRASLQRGRDG